MTTHWIWANERTDEYAFSLDTIPAALQQLDICLDTGERVTSSLPAIEIGYQPHADEYLTDNLVAPTCLGLLIHGKIKTIFDSLRIDNLQYFEAKLVHTATHAINSQYVLANIVGKFDVIDHEHSQLQYYPDGEIQFIDKLALNAACQHIPEKIFRPRGFLPLIIVHDQVKRAIEQHAISGMVFYRPEDYSL